MTRLFTIIIFFLGWSAYMNNVQAQANPSIAILPVNSGGIVNLGAVMDVKVTISNTLTGTIPAFKLRPNITIPSIATILPNAQQTGLPPGWTIVTNNGNGQIRICNGSNTIAGNTQVDVIIKVQGTTIGGPAQCEAQLNYGGASCAVTGPQPNGNNPIDDFATSSVTVAPGCALGITANAGIIACNGGTTTITATASAATGPVEYSITGGAPFQTSNIFSNVAAGIYPVTVREINNPATCIVSTSLTVEAPAAVPAPAVTIVQPTCTSANGMVTIAAATGLNFKVNGGSFESYPPGGYLLPPGTHNITAQNTGGCVSAVTTFIINPQPATPSAPELGSVTQPGCAVSTGSVVLNNLPAGTWTIEPGTVTGNASATTIHNLAAGNYVFTVTNAEGCTSAASAAVEIIAVTGAPPAPVVMAVQPSCNVATGTISVISPVDDLTFSLDGNAYVIYPAGGFTGITAGTHTLIAQNASGCLSPITSVVVNAQPASPPAPAINVVQPTCTVSTGILTVTSATAGVTFSLDGGNFEAYPAGGYAVVPGIHSLAVQNNSGCDANSINNILVNAQPATPAATATFTPINCFGSSSMITAAATGGVLPYRYSINGGAFQSENTFTVNAGSYSISVKDANGCTGNSSTMIIAEPAAITATATAAPIACNGGNTTLTITATGGSGSYEYNINNGPYQAANTFLVGAGTYTAGVRLSNNPSCTATSNVVVNVGEPAVLKATANADAIRACGENTIVKITATGGTAPYTGTANIEKGPGNWSFTVTDARGCTTSANVIILPPGCLDLAVYPNPAQDVITINHSAASGDASYLQVYAENGKRMLNYRVPENDFVTKLNVASLSAGSYILLYINGNEKRRTRFIKTTP